MKFIGYELRIYVVLNNLEKIKTMIDKNLVKIVKWPMKCNVSFENMVPDFKNQGTISGTISIWRK